jgi:hypothetical protein
MYNETRGLVTAGFFVLPRRRHAVLVIPTEARDILARFAFGLPPVIAAEIEIGLFANNFNPVLATTFANLVEPTFPGYSRRAVGRGNTTYQANGLARAALLGGANQTWVSTGGEDIVYGWFARDSGSGQLLGVERFSNAVAMHPNTTLVLTPAVDTGAILVGG